jgi:DNA-binding MarR family transcriptional regulator
MVENMSTSPASLRVLLHRFGLERDRLRAALCRRAGITESELAALEYLEADGPLTQRELGERLLLSSGGITVLVDRLEGAGWVARKPHPTDRRAVLLELDRKALASLPAGLGEYHAAIAAAARAVAPEHRDATAAFLSAASTAATTASYLDSPG